MISLAAIEDSHASSLTSGTRTIAQNADDLLSAILDCAVFYRWKTEVDGRETAYFQLVKPLPGLPVGMVLSLRDLHERLWGKVLK